MLVVIDNTIGPKPIFRQYLLSFLRRQRHGHAIARTLSEVVEISRTKQVSGFILTGSQLHVHDIGRDREAMNTFALRHGAPVLGICFGAQFINLYFGGHLEYTGAPVHHTRGIKIIGARIGLVEGVPMKLEADFYAAYSISDLAPCMRPICLDEVQRVVAFRHKRRRIWGTLFHPESICAHTELILNNFIQTVQKWAPPKTSEKTLHLGNNTFNKKKNEECRRKRLLKFNG